MSKIAYPIKLYFKYRLNLVMFVLALLINITNWLWIVLRIRPQNESVFLHYNILFGVDYIGEWWRIYIIAFTGLVIFVINFLLGWLLFNKDKFVSILMNIVNVVSQVFLLIATAILVFLNV
ncbi:MAG: hypothetical protein Q8P20_03110 [bacterium]|nr:hypothetical protein [bacterium]